MMPWIGTVVAGPLRRLTDTRRELLAHEVSRLISEARRVGLELDEVIQAIRVKIGGSESFHMECGANSRSRQG
jgi:DNA-binding transcriptional regulator YhcF (GntR family)